MTVCVRADRDGAKTLLAIGGILWAFAAGVLAARATEHLDFTRSGRQAETAAERIYSAAMEKVIHGNGPMPHLAGKLGSGGTVGRGGTAKP